MLLGFEEFMLIDMLFEIYRFLPCFNLHIITTPDKDSN